MASEREMKHGIGHQTDSHNRTLTIDFHDETTHIPPRLLLDSRVVDVTRSYNPIFITISSFKPFLFNNLINEWRFVDRMEA